MGCGGSKQGVVAATGSCVSYRRLLRTRSGAANSHFKTPTAFADVAGKAPAAPATAKAAVASALSDVVEEVTVEVDVVRMAAPSVGEEAGRSRAAPPEEPPTSGYSTARSSTDEEDGGSACAGDAHAGSREAKSSENGGGCAGERRGHHGWVHEAEEGEKMTCSLPPPNLCDAHDASKPGVHGEGPTDQGDQKTSPDQCNVQMEDLRMQLQQVAEQLAVFQVWGREDDDNGDTEKAVTEEEKHQEEGLNTRLEEGPEFVKEPVFKEEEGEEEEDQFGDAAEVFKEDFSSKIPVYDEYPHDLPQVPSVGCDFSAEGNAITSYLSFGREGTDDDQIQQVLYQKFVKVRRSKAYGSGGKKRRTHYELHQTQIRKHRKRRTYEPVR